MKTNKYSILRWLVIAICALPLMSAGCEKDDPVNTPSGGSSSGGGGSQPSKPSYADYVDIVINHCERVGSVLMIEYSVTNKKNETIEVELQYPKVTDNNGTTYGPVMAFGENEYTVSDVWAISAKLSGRASVKGHAKVKNFDPSNTAANVSFEVPVYIKNVDLDNNNRQYRKTNINVIDNRIMAHGIQTNDLNLQWTMNKCYRGANGTLYVNFTVKNNTNSVLSDFEFIKYPYDEAYDNLGNKYEHFGFRWGTEGSYNFNGISFLNSTSISAGSSAIGTFCIENFSASATEISGSFCVGVSNYIMNDDKVRFMTIPIE